MCKQVFLIVLLFLNAFPCLKAQDFNPSFSAEQTISYINQLAQGGLGLDRDLPLSEIKFKGISHFEKISDGGDITIEISNLDWANLVDVRSATYSWNNNITYVNAEFSTKAKRVTTFYRENTNEVYNKSFKQDVFFSIRLPAGETGKVENLKKAFNHLGQLAKKSLPVVLRLPVTGKKPAAGSPSYEETVGYITETLIDHEDEKKRTVFSSRTHYTKQSRDYVILGISFTQSIFEIAYKITDPDTKKSEVKYHSVDLSRVEKIYIASDANVIRDHAVWFLSFKYKGEPNNWPRHVPIGAAPVEENGVDYSAWKIFKAFNHLRKLFGAPEPISFD